MKVMCIENKYKIKIFKLIDNCDQFIEIKFFI